MGRSIASKTFLSAYARNEGRPYPSPSGASAATRRSTAPSPSPVAGIQRRSQSQSQEEEKEVDGSGERVYKWSQRPFDEDHFDPEVAVWEAFVPSPSPSAVPVENAGDSCPAPTRVSDMLQTIVSAPAQDRSSRARQMLLGLGSDIVERTAALEAGTATESEQSLRARQDRAAEVLDEIARRGWLPEGGAATEGRREVGVGA